MKVSVVLADKGTNNPQQGTLNLLNAGWVQTQLTSSPLVPGALVTPPHAVAIFFEVEHSLCNRPIEIVLALLTEDGRPVEVPSATGGEQQVTVGSVVTVPSPAMAPLGTPGTGNALIEIFPGLLVPPGGYRWNVTLAGEHHEEWFAAFRVLPPPQMPSFTFGVPVSPPAPEIPEDPGTPPNNGE
jgi:hypothetical protein